MKLWISFALALALVVACVSVPLGRRTVWGHAKDHGVPQATGRVIAAGARGIAGGVAAAWTWMTARPEDGKAVAEGAARRAARRDETKAPRSATPAAHTRVGPAKDGLVPGKAWLAPEAPTAPVVHGILEAPPAEKITETDKTALDRLVVGSVKHN